MFPNAGELLNDKLGVHFSTVKTNQFADFGDISRPFTEQERAIAQKYINNGYELFTRRCADGRKMKQDDIKQIGEGRVWTGIHAKQIGLVDELGSLDAAIAKAKKLAKLDEASVMNYPTKSNILDQLLEEMQGTSYADKQLKQTLGDYYPLWTDLKNARQKTGVQTALPYRLKFKL
jgi:protease-4